MAEFFVYLAILLFLIAIAVGILGWIGRIGMWLVKWLVIILIIAGILLLIF